jgi:hypothetical protein
MAEQLAKRDATQPTKDRTAGSTFRNPAGFSSTGRDDDTHDLKAWKVIDDAGMRGATAGRGADVADAFQLPRQHRWRNRRRPRRTGRGGAKKGFRDQRNNARVGNQADRSAKADRPFRDRPPQQDGGDNEQTADRATEFRRQTEA